MLSNLFQVIFKMSLVSSVVAVCVLSVKLFLQRVGISRRITFFLWGIIAFRLLFPVVPQSAVSPFNMLNHFETNQEPTEMQMLVKENVIHIYAGEASSDISANDKEVFDIRKYIPIIWIFGAVIMLLAGVLSWMKLKRKLRFSVKFKENIYFCDSFTASFVFGVIRPKIYVSADADEKTLSYIIVHEKEHIHRLDHISKLLAYAILSLHWFNPLVWLMFKLFSEDVEIACDEGVISGIGFEKRKAYLNSLIDAASKHKKMSLVFNTYFSFGLTQKRIKYMISLKKSSKALNYGAALICAFLVISFSTNAVEMKPEVTAEKQQDINMIPQNSVPEQEIQINREKPEVQKYSNEVRKQNTYKNYKQEIPLREIKPSDNSKAKETAEPEKQSIKSQEKYDVSEAGFEQIVLDNANIKYIQDELSNNGIVMTEENNIDLRQNYAVREYSYEDSLEYENNDIKCDENGNISLYFDVNSENIVNVGFYDSETNEEIGSYGILASEQNAYTFSGFEEDKSYNMKIEGSTQDNWQIEGEYIIY